MWFNLQGMFKEIKLLWQMERDEKQISSLWSYCRELFFSRIFQNDSFATPKKHAQELPPRVKTSIATKLLRAEQKSWKKFSTPAKKTKNLMKVHAKQRTNLIFQKNANWFSRRFFSSILIGIDEKVFPSRHFL